MCSLVRGDVNMSVEEKIECILEQRQSEKLNSIWRVTKEIIEDTKDHLKQITTQMSSFDIHDEEHSKKVISIIENLLGESIEKLSFYELLLIYMSVYIHDAAMALPAWEYMLIRAVEGTEEIYDNTLEFRVLNDFKPVHKFEEAIKIIRDNKEKLYGTYEKAKNYIFIENTENKLIEDLASLLCNYERFRNGYVEELKKYKANTTQYLNYSKMVRCEFIRSTHHTRIEQCIKGIKRKYVDIIGSFSTERFIDDLGNICRGHGEQISYVLELNTRSRVTEEMQGNIQFIAMLLRLGDVIHFSADRAPMSLFAEKNITDETSLKHWTAKFQELKYDFYNHSNHIYVKFSAYCSLPSVYYFIQDYMDWIDNEISNYYTLKQKWEYDRLENIEYYNINIGNKVDRSEIAFDKSIFIPSNSMKFTLEQSKILELLMGIQLYKDKYLCLREIYQNSLDATKCMIAYNEVKGVKEETFIEFGIGEEYIDDSLRKYIYCLDHGTGMDEYIIENFLLHIGNSYYKSREFKKKNIEWYEGVKPTSQFGIGLLAGYMIADKIGITTRYYESGSRLISFILEGVNEHCYYVTPSKVEDEKIGAHGTMIKLYLNSKVVTKINNKYINKLPLFFMTHNNEFIKSYIEMDSYENNLMYLLCRNIGVENKDIPIYIVDEHGDRKRILSGCKIFDYKDYPEIEKLDVVKLWSGYPRQSDNIDFYNRIIEAKEKIKEYIIEINTESLQVYSHLSLPNKGMNDSNLEMYSYCKFIGENEGSILVDGIIISDRTPSKDDITEILGRDIVKNSILNFIGDKRPILSVDRNSIISMPQIQDELNSVRQEYINEIVQCIYKHIQDNEISTSSDEMNIILEIIVVKFPTLSGAILRKLCDTEISQAAIARDVWQDGGIKIEDIIRGHELEITNCDFRKYTETTRQIILGKAIGAKTVSMRDGHLNLIGDKFIEFPVPGHYWRSRDISLTSLVICADEWSGMFSEYDIVSNMWPIVSKDLYTSLELGYEIEEIVEGRSKTISESSNGIQAIAQFNPVMINPRVGIGIEDDRWGKSKCMVGEFDRIANNFWLFELNNHGEMVREQKKDYVLYTYIAPRGLNNEEEMRVKELEERDPDYVKGVYEGWSILFIGKIQKYVILPGIQTREDMIKSVPKSYLELEGDITYYNTDGTKAFE